MNNRDGEQPLGEGAPAPQPTTALLDRPSARGLEDPRPQVLTLSTGTEEKPNPFSLSRLLSAVAHRFWLAFPLGILLAATSVAALWYLGEDQYRSFAWVRVRDKPEYLAFPSNENSRRFVETQVELMRSPVIVGRAVESEEVRGLAEIKELEGKVDLVEWVKKRLTVSAIGRSDLYEIAVLTREAEASSAIVTAIVETYMNFHASISDEQYARMRELLDGELKLRRRDAEMKRTVLRDLTREAAGRTTGVVQEVEGQSIQGRLAVLGSMQQRLLDAEVNTEILKANIAAFRETMSQSVQISEQEVADLVEQDSRLMAWKEELAAAQESLKPVLPGPSSMRKTIEGKVADLEKRIAERREELIPQFDKMARDQVDGRRQAEIRRLENELAREEGLAQYFRDRIAEERVQHQEHGDVTLEIELARIDLNHAQEIHDKISARIVAMDTERRAPSQVDVVQDAAVPKFPEGTSLPKKMMALGLAAFFLPFGLFTGYEMMVKRIYDSSQLRQETEIDFVGEVATLPVRRRLRTSRAFDRQAYILEESVDSVRTALAVTDREERQKVVVVCSAVSGEGKTHLSAQLALSWSRGQVGPVLLIDADMRSPSMHEMFDIDLGPGLVDVLRGSATLQESIVTDWGEGVHLLPAGKLGAYHPDRLIASQRFARLLEVARENYSRIIIDVPPILSAHETLLIAKMSDGALLCALRDYSRSKQVQDAHQRLTRAGVNVMGAVLNGTPTKSYVYHYGSYYT